MKRDWIRACGLAAALILMLIAPQRADAVDVSPSALSFGTIVVGDTGGPLQVTVSTYYWASIASQLAVISRRTMIARRGCRCLAAAGFWSRSSL